MVLVGGWLRQTTVRGPAIQLPPLEDGEAKADEHQDIVDEAIAYFRANVLFKSFEVKGSADRVLAYLTLFIHLVSRVW